MTWTIADIADAIEIGLKEQARQGDIEQVVYGFDCLDELALHPIIQQSLRDAGFGVWPEQRYPASWQIKKRTQGKRCDIVLTPNCDSQGLREPEIKNTLFDLPSLTDPQDAFWLEIKTVAQFETAGPFRRYASELLSPVTADIKKLQTDGNICHAGLLLVLFTETQSVGEHDLATWHRRAIERGHCISMPCMRGFEMTNRIGNGWCNVALFGIPCRH